MILRRSKASVSLETGSSPLAWQTTGPWAYSLGTFGTITGIFGLRLWAARVNGFVVGVHESIGDARRTVEKAAREAGHAIAQEGA